MNRKFFLLVVLSALLAVSLAACATAAAPAEGGAPAAEGGVPAICPTLDPAACEGAGLVVPFEEAWAGSGHADAAAEAFVHWNEDDPAEVPVECAKCHSTTGAQDFQGADGSAAGVVDAAVPVGEVVSCVACHNDATVGLTSVTFPSGATFDDAGSSAVCMQCHSGNASTVQVNEAIAGQDLDTVNAELGFINIHYFSAAATLYGGDAMGGYQYDGKSYMGRFDHVEGYQSCADCHNTHTLEVKVEECASCHEGVTAETLTDIRMMGSLRDYDGDGNTEEGIYYEIEGLREVLYAGIQAYAADVAGAPIAYDIAAYPYFFNDTNANGTADADEANFGNKYASWTPRLLQAAYNYQVSLKDPGNYAHNAKYHIELLFDSIEALDEVGVEGLARNDAGHFDATSEAFRHWDGEEDGGIVPGTCSKCHAAGGLPFFLAEGVSVSRPAQNSLSCTTCHDPSAEFALYQVAAVPFPSGASLTFGENDESNLCIECHQGRESTVSVDRVIAAAGVGDNVVSEALRFRNPHYFAAGATLFGTEARGAYEYAGKTYVGRNMHVEKFDTCAECHDVHALELDLEACTTCHEGESPEDYRVVDEGETPVDYDGDGDVEEGIAGEISTMSEVLYASLQTYAANQGAPIVYNGARYPYFFGDTDGNGEVNGEEAAYAAWSPALLRAAYNYKYVAADPGNFAHNSTYALQILYDSIQAISGGSGVAGMTRP